MKGIAHFLTGIALATCFPAVVAQARQGSLLPVLAGVGAMLPDLLDFRFVRYLVRYDAEIDPGPVPDAATAKTAAASVAGALARTMRDAFERGTPQRVIAHTLRLGADLWRRYTICFEPERGEVAVRMGPLINTGGVDTPGTLPPDAIAARRLGIPLSDSYSRCYDVGAFTGPSFTFAREGDTLAIHFLDWHHGWTHSLPLAVLAGLVAGALVGLAWGEAAGRWSGLLVAMGAAAHAVEDQLGYMGCGLAWPMIRRRLPGLRLLHASEAVPNFLVVWTSLALILFNLDRFGGPGLLPLGPYVLLAIVLPWLILGSLHLARRRRATAEPALSPTADAERLAEAGGLGQ